MIERGATFGLLFSFAVAAAGCSEPEGVCLSKSKTQEFCAPAPAGKCAADAVFAPLEPRFKRSGSTAMQREQGMCGGLGYLCGGAFACTKDSPR